MVSYGRTVVERTLDELGVEFEENFGTPWAKATCPLHDDERPSFTVHLDEGGWACYSGCGSSGDLALLVEAVTGEPAATARLRMRRGLVMDPEAFDRLMHDKPREKPVEDEQLSEEDARYTPNVAPRYLIRRGFEPATLKAWRVGFDEQDVSAVLPVMEGDRLVSVIRRRVNPQVQPKYLYPRSFRKSEALFGLHMVDKSARSVVVVEGPLDAMWTWQCGLPAVAILGSFISPEQSRKLERRFWEVLLALDADKAGQAGMDRAAKLLRRVNVRYVSIPGGKKDLQECSCDEVNLAVGQAHVIR